RAVRSVNSGEEALAAISDYEPDVLILDIDLGKGISGIEVAHRVRKIFSVALIYLTQFDEEDLVQNALATQPGAYLLKPFRANQVAIAISQALQALPSATATFAPNADSIAVTDAFFIRTGDAYQKIPISEVLFIRADRRYSDLVTNQQTYTVSTSLQHLMEQIPKGGLIRVHRSYAVRVAAITAFTSQTLQIGKETIPVSEPYREALKQALDPNTLRSK
ncbi:MAG TPA: hypothetical protein DCE41_37735, partial [Cytophagales bacterium]|nr:hypothetical protein [Cytophagales bacterium]